MINTRLKAKIFEAYGTQADFAQAIKTDETLISRVVRNRRILSPVAQRKWAKALKCKPEELFFQEK
ncbi:unnamed protein product [marine sediment metagenome]|uniref:HTH cro/C1-type domain-containing protein n=1 Tax=marine sediment metagenome TaxID=412755 RepID=X1ASW7_9ZZZZ